jgi:hypothetical protein
LITKKKNLCKNNLETQLIFDKFKVKKRKKRRKILNNKKGFSAKYLEYSAKMERQLKNNTRNKKILRGHLRLKLVIEEK